FFLLARLHVDRSGGRVCFVGLRFRIRGALAGPSIRLGIRRPVHDEAPPEDQSRNRLPSWCPNCPNNWAMFAARSGNLRRSANPRNVQKVVVLLRKRWWARQGSNL